MTPYISELPLLNPFLPALPVMESCFPQSLHTTLTALAAASTGSTGSTGSTTSTTSTGNTSSTASTTSTSGSSSSIGVPEGFLVTPYGTRNIDLKAPAIGLSDKVGLLISVYAYSYTKTSLALPVVHTTTDSTTNDVLQFSSVNAKLFYSNKMNIDSAQFGVTAKGIEYIQMNADTIPKGLLYGLIGMRTGERAVISIPNATGWGLSTRVQYQAAGFLKALVAAAKTNTVLTSNSGYLIFDVQVTSVEQYIRSTESKSKKRNNCIDFLLS